MRNERSAGINRQFRLRVATKFSLSPIAWALCAAVLASSLAAQEAWHRAPARLATRWAKDVSPANAHPEYPRPQMVRKDWLNLNGLWDYAIRSTGPAPPSAFDGQILVPFPLESALSGVMTPGGATKGLQPVDRLWYRRSFNVPAAWEGKRVLLHFGAVDWEATVWVNGQQLGSHRGGYDGFSFDITDTLKLSGAQEILVSVQDPTNFGTQPRGKQVRDPHGIWYTPTSGIWQTVWLEPVAEAHIESVKITPDFDQSTVTLEVAAVATGGKSTVKVEVLDGENVVQSGEISVDGDRGRIAPRISFKIPDAKPWSPDSPFLYGLRITFYAAAKRVDELDSYFGLRKISLGKDEHGITRLLLNNKPLFQFGPLDQGFWPDGLYTAPTDEALRYDIEMTKKLGFNLARKHVKIEPDRWYYWADKLGLLVWQDMPSGDKYIGGRDPDITRTPESGRQFETELKALIDGRGNHPCIVMWVPYNEGWGQWDTPRIVDLLKSWDPTRLVINASGWTDRGVGDVNDIHAYPGPAAPRPEEKRAAVLGEFGGLGLPVKHHTWDEEKSWGYRSFKTPEELTDSYVALIAKLHPLTGPGGGLSAAVYTQTTDVEIEVNGLLTYDRELLKMDEATITAANKRLYTPPPPRREQGNQLVPPATPLVACDPYFSIWSQGDKLTDVETTHWTGRPHRLTSLVRIDAKPYRLMGDAPPFVAGLPQKNLTVLPTRTIYEFEGAGVHLTLTFMTAALPDNLETLSRPVTYVTWDVRASDGQTHDMELYFDCTSELVVNEPSQSVVWSSEQIGDLATWRFGSEQQRILGKKGDDLRIDWGYLYVAVPKSASPAGFVQIGMTPRRFFAEHGSIRRAMIRMLAPPSPSSQMLVAPFDFDLSKIGPQPVSRWLMLAYDDLYSIQYMGHNLRPYWRRNGWEAADLLKAAAKDYESLKQRCAAFDEELMADLTRAGGEKYAKLAVLAYRQCFAAGKFVADDNGQPLQFCKENHSNGCIGTSDVFYPMAPQFLLFGPTLAKSFLVPFMNYAASDRWKFPFAPHDLGTYPHANGQVYGDGERGVNNQMPVEESGNLLLLFGAIAQMEGHANFAGLYWKQLEQWAEYLKEKGFDPENQLCTDDFAGHLAHNVNLSAKAICGLGAFAKLCELRGDKTKAEEYFRLARGFAARWVKEADDGDHFRLAFDKPGTWSQKYNLIWDRILGLSLFPADVLRKEMDYYKKIQNQYGLPLDNRKDYTKLDWILWTATLTQNRADFEALMDPVFRFLNETPDRSPMTDWYETKTAKKAGFTARPVVGGVFAQMLYDKAVWAKWASRDKTKAANWAPMPKPPKTVVVVPTSQDQGLEWRFTTTKPSGQWFAPDFDDSMWQRGPGGFGTRGTPGAVVRTEWNTPDIWLRRAFDLPADFKPRQLRLLLHHDEDAEVFLNGQSGAEVSGYTTEYDSVPLAAAAEGALRPGRNVIAVHCHQTGGGQYIDVGVAALTQDAGR